MSPRRNRQRRAASPGPQPEPWSAGGAAGPEWTEDWRGEPWRVRPVAGASGKRYRCPGCDQEIQPGVGHLVAWPGYGGVDDRRHWHRACWNARERRAAKQQRARQAPRY